MENTATALPLLDLFGEQVIIQRRSFERRPRRKASPARVFQLGFLDILEMSDAELESLRTRDEITDDYVMDDSALAIKTEDGLVVVTGCSHAGIANIIEYAKQVTGENHIVSVIGGFHLQDADEDRLTQTGDYLKALSPDSLYPCHCTDLAAKISLARFIKINEVGVGLKLDFSAAGK